MYSNATAHTARAFLGEAAARLDIGTVQVGQRRSSCAIHGSDFESECEAPGLPLLVLPPRSPQLNGIGRCLLKQSAPTARCASSAGASTGRTCLRRDEQRPWTATSTTTTTAAGTAGWA